MRTTSRACSSLRELGALDFQVACFSHGRPLTEGAAAAVRQDLGSATP